MPSKSVSFSDSAYARLVNTQPENMNFSEWVETLTNESLNARQQAQKDEQTTTETN